MKKYLITVKGISYEVEVEEIKDNAPQSKAAAPAPVRAAAPAAPAPAKAAPAPSAPAGGTASVTSPMPGSIFKVHVKAGDSVKRGDVLIILEAMKMENEIFAAADGVVDSVLVKEGATVNTGDVLVTFK
ncbi:MAG: biotin/lipoyl-containing protein [Sedimentibacter sp.]|uniref:biotin/lipoyl-containing protein n=1 Tax=Sedimentibacter sp. TaxID=1960295 RepID=UPI00315920AF